jgi:hypothetical protein
MMTLLKYYYLLYKWNKDICPIDNQFIMTFYPCEYAANRAINRLKTLRNNYLIYKRSTKWI